jgi:hypothetical protein
MVVGAFWSRATRTKRHWLQASTAQNTCQPPSSLHSMTKCSPSVGTHGPEHPPLAAPRGLRLSPSKGPHLLIGGDDVHSLLR